MLAPPARVPLLSFGRIYLRLCENFRARMTRGLFDLRNEIRLELLLAHESEEMGGPLEVGFVEPGTGTDDGLSIGHNMVSIVRVLGTETPRNHRIGVDPYPLVGGLLEERQPATFSGNELNVLVRRVATLPVDPSTSTFCGVGRLIIVAHRREAGTRLAANRVPSGSDTSM